MAKYASFGKRENEKKKQARRVEKQNRKEERKSSGKATSFEDMIAYVDENGMITSVPPELRQKEEINQEDILISTPKKEDVAPVILRGRVDYFNEAKGTRRGVPVPQQTTSFAPDTFASWKRRINAGSTWL